MTFIKRELALTVSTFFMSATGFTRPHSLGEWDLERVAE